MSDREKRYTDGLEIRKGSESTPGPGTLVGYAARYDCPSQPLHDKKSGRSFVEYVKPGAFSRSLKTADVRALFDHEPGKVLGRSKAGTLRVSEDARGLRVEIDLPDTTAGRDTAVSVARGDVTGMSFGFYTPANGDSWDLTTSPATRHLKDVDIDDVTVTAYPAYPDTSVAMRSLTRAEAEAAAPAPEPTPEAAPEPTPESEPDDAAALLARLDNASSV